MTITTTSFFHTDVWPTRKTHLSRCQMLPFEKRNLLFFCNFLDWRMIWCVFWKTTYRSQISLFWSMFNHIYMKKNWHYRKLLFSCTRERDNSDLCWTASWFSTSNVSNLSRGETIFETNSKIFYSKYKIFLTLRSFSSLTDAGSTLVSEIQ